MKRRQFIQTSSYLFTESVLAFNSPLPLHSVPNTFFKRNNKKLYNGIILPETWPPMHLSPESDEPMPVPYLQNRPEVIPIDIGRQLFVDDFLIERTNLKRTYHQSVKFNGNPVFKPLSDDETGGPDGKRSVVYTGHGGVFYDFKDKVFKMFYRSGWLGGLALAISKDMVHWERPELNLAGGNLLLPKGHIYTGKDLTSAGSDNSVWLDSLATNESEKIKFLTCWMHVPPEQRPKHTTHTMHVSDGKKWSKAHPTGKAGDYCSIFHNPFRNVWVSSIRVSDGPRGRCRYYYEDKSFLDADWSRAVYWTNSDKFDKPEPEGKYPGPGETPQLYSLNAIAYESIMIGMHQIHRGPSNAICDEGKFPKLSDLEIGYSRDGFHWFRPDRKGFIKGERTEGTWDRAYIHSTTGVFVVLSDKLIFPYTGFSGIAEDGSRGSYNGASIGIAILRRDGFASMDSGSNAGRLTTKPVVFSGKHLFVNVDSSKGHLQAEVCDLNGKPISPFTFQNSIPFKGDSTIKMMKWNTESDLSSIKGKPVRLNFELKNGAFYSFWISKNITGRSDGFLAAGGPGYSGIIDTDGKKVMEQGCNEF